MVDCIASCIVNYGEVIVTCIIQMLACIANLIKDYGQVIVTCIIAFIAWQALRENREQNKIAKAEKYVKLLWQLKEAATDDLAQALVDDIVDDFHLKPINARERTFFLSAINNLHFINLQLLLIGKVFPKIAKNMSQLEADIKLMINKAFKLEKQIRGELKKQLADELRVSEADVKAKKLQAIDQVIDFFAADDKFIKRIKKTHNAMHDYLAAYVKKGYE